MIRWHLVIPICVMLAGALGILFTNIAGIFKLVIVMVLLCIAAAMLGGQHVADIQRKVQDMQDGR